MSNEKNKQSISVSYQRTNPVPLDGTCTFESLADACIYVCKEDTTAYPGQVVTVKGMNEVFVVTQSAEGQLNLDLFDYDVYYAMSIVYPDNLYVLPKGQTELPDYTGSIQMITTQHVLLPGSLKSIGSKTLQGASFISDYIIPTSVETISSNVFNGSSITSVVVPPRVKTLGASTFNSCVSLKKAEILCPIDHIRSYMFCYCSNLEEVVLPDTIENIQQTAFSNCTSLTKINLPNGLKTIKTEAFVNCRGLANNLKIPESVIEIENSAFTGMSEMVYNDESYVDTWLTENFTYENKPDTMYFGLMIKSGTIGIQNGACYEKFPEGGVSIGFVSLPNSLKYIGSHAFYNCDGLGTIDLPQNLKRIGKYAFYGCAQQTMTIPASVEYIGAYAICNGPEIEFEDAAKGGWYVSANEDLSNARAIPAGSEKDYYSNQDFSCYWFRKKDEVTD